MKKIAITVIILTISTSILFIGFLYSYYSPAKKITLYKMNQQQDDTLRIAFIGDSWAFYHKFHPCRIDSSISNELHKPVKVLSEGICGATSKFICSRISAEGDIKEIMKKHPEFCVIAAGVNDTHLKLGESFYLTNMRSIVDFLTFNHITPIIIEIPDYNIFKLYNDINPIKKILRNISMIVTGSNMDCRNDYRQALRTMIRKNYQPGSILFLNFNQWNSDYSHDTDSVYREDEIHLNSKGYNIIDSCLTKIIIEFYKKHNHSQTEFNKQNSIVFCQKFAN